MGKGVGRAADSRAAALPAASPSPPASHRPPPSPTAAGEQNRFRLCSYLGLRFCKALLALR